MMHYQLWNEQDSDRIIPVIGSLSLPKLGIQSDLFNRLAEKLDAIYHCGSWVNIIYPYSALEASNVLGTEEILRLASQNHIKPVHYISTIDVYRSNGTAILRNVKPETEVGPVGSLFSGYAKSKYVAEALILEARNRGIPATIYRPSNIMGDSRNGICPKSNFVTQKIMGCLQFGFAPDMEAALNLVPVDYVSRTIIHLSRCQQVLGQDFNLVNPQAYRWVDLVQWMQQKKGYQLQLVSYEVWCAKALEIIGQNQEHPLFFLTTFLTNFPFVQKSLGALYFEANPLLSRLTPPSMHCAPINDELLQLYFASLVHQELIPTPEVQVGQRDLSSGVTHGSRLTA